MDQAVPLPRERAGRLPLRLVHGPRRHGWPRGAARRGLGPAHAPRPGLRLARAGLPLTKWEGDPQASSSGGSPPGLSPSATKTGWRFVAAANEALHGLAGGDSPTWPLESIGDRGLAEHGDRSQPPSELRPFAVAERAQRAPADLGSVDTMTRAARSAASTSGRGVGVRQSLRASTSKPEDEDLPTPASTPPAAKLGSTVLDDADRAASHPPTTVKKTRNRRPRPIAR